MGFSLSGNVTNTSTLASTNQSEHDATQTAIAAQNATVTDISNRAQRIEQTLPLLM